MKIQHHALGEVGSDVGMFVAIVSPQARTQTHTQTGVDLAAEGQQEEPSATASCRMGRFSKTDPSWEAASAAG